MSRIARRELISITCLLLLFVAVQVEQVRALLVGAVEDLVRGDEFLSTDAAAAQCIGLCQEHGLALPKTSLCLWFSVQSLAPVASCSQSLHTEQQSRVAAVMPEGIQHEGLSLRVPIRRRRLLPHELLRLIRRVELIVCLLRGQVLLNVRFISEVQTNVEQDDEKDDKEQEVAVDDKSQGRVPQSGRIQIYVRPLECERLVAILYLLIIDESVPVDEPRCLSKKDPHSV